MATMREEIERIRMDRIKRSACTGKRKFTSFTAAQIQAEAMQRRSGARFNSYRCEFCRSWHIGHVSKGGYR